MVWIGDLASVSVIIVSLVIMWILEMNNPVSFMVSYRVQTPNTQVSNVPGTGG